MRHISSETKHPKRGTECRFGLAAAANTIATNAFFQGLLAINVAIPISTLSSQLFNGTTGYLAYDKFAFRASLQERGAVSKYIILVFCLWLANWAGIRILKLAGLTKPIAALSMIRPLGVASYLVQLNWVFKKP